MKPLNLILVGYAIVSIVLGVMGFAKHPMSFYMGAGAGILVLVGVYIAAKKPSIGYGIAAVIALGNIGNFLPKIMKEFKLIPGGVMTLTSGIVLGALIAAHFANKKAKSS